MRDQRKWGVLLSYSSQGIHILSGILYTPVMLRLLGQSEYGLYQLVSATVSYLSLLSLGFTSSYMKFYSQIKKKGDEDEVDRYNGMFMTIFLIMSAVCIFCGIIMVINIRMIFGEGLTDTEYFLARILMILLIINLALTFPSSVFDSITSMQERFVFQKGLAVAQSILNPFISLPLLIMGYGSVAMVVVATLLTLAKLLSNYLFCKKKLHVRFLFQHFNFGLLKEMWIFTSFIFINLIVDQINWSIDKFLLGRLAGTVAVAVYGIGGQLNTLYIQLSTSISSVFAPKVNKIVAERNDNTELTQLFIKIGRIQFILLSLVISGFIFFGQTFVRFWAGDGYAESYTVGVFLMIPVTIPLIQNIGIEIQRAKNMHKARSIVYLFIAIANIVVSIPLIRHWGAVGAAVGTSLSLLVGNGLFMNWYYQYRTGIDIKLFWKNILSFWRAFIIPFLFAFLLKNVFKNMSISVWAVSCFLYMLVYGVSFWKLGMNQEEKQMIASIVNIVNSSKKEK